MFRPSYTYLRIEYCMSFLAGPPLAGEPPFAKTETRNPPVLNPPLAYDAGCSLSHPALPARVLGSVHVLQKEHPVPQYQPVQPANVRGCQKRAANIIEATGCRRRGSGTYGVVKSDYNGIGERGCCRIRTRRYGDVCIPLVFHPCLLHVRYDGVASRGWHR